MKKIKIETPHPDPIIVVPLHTPKTPLPLETLTEKKGGELFKGKIKAPAGAKLTYRGGPLISKVKIYTIFWGKHWATTASLKTTATKLNTFFKKITASSLITQLAEYNVAGYSIQKGKLVGTKNIAAGAPAASITDTQIKTALQQWIHAGTVPKNDVNTLYFIYFEPHIKVIQGGSASCSSFCGYHNSIGSNIFYAVMPYPSCSGCIGGLASPFDALTGTSSHEMCEAITDPVPGSGWYDDNNGEIGDICAWTFKTVDGFTVQKEWSNAAKACI